MNAFHTNTNCFQLHLPGLTTFWAVINLFFSGFFIDPSQLSIKNLAPLKYFSAVRLAYQGSVVLELRGRLFACGDGDKVRRDARLLI